MSVLVGAEGYGSSSLRRCYVQTPSGYVRQSPSTVSKQSSSLSLLFRVIRLPLLLFYCSSST